MSLLQDILYVITDGLHKSGFKQQTQILALLIQGIATGYVRNFFFFISSYRLLFL